MVVGAERGDLGEEEDEVLSFFHAEKVFVGYPSALYFSTSLPHTVRITRDEGVKCIGSEC